MTAFGDQALNQFLFACRRQTLRNVLEHVTHDLAGVTYWKDDHGTYVEHPWYTDAKKSLATIADLPTMAAAPDRNNTEREVVASSRSGEARADKSFIVAAELTRQRLGDQARTVNADVQSGTYQGQLIAETTEHILMRISKHLAVAHPRILLDSSNNLLREGETVRINYHNEISSVSPVRPRSEDKSLGR